MNNSAAGTRASHNVAIVGATGLVGETLLRLLEERAFPVGDLRLFATSRSAGQERAAFGRRIPVQTIPTDSAATANAATASVFEGIDVAFFAAGESVAKQWAPPLAARGTLVVDKSTAFRLEHGIPLIVPEVNIQAAQGRSLIANPNCSTIPLAVALNMVQREFGLRWVSVATYQSVSGAGKDAVSEFERQLAGSQQHNALPRRIAGNVFPEVGAFDASGYCEEERKIALELRKIFNSDAIAVSATTVRVPVAVAHAAAIAFQTATRTTRAEIAATIAASPGVQFLEGAQYVSPLEAAGQDAVFVGRLRPDLAHPGAFVAWVACDNLRKGAALNAVQIAELLLARRVELSA